MEGIGNDSYVISTLILFFSGLLNSQQGDQSFVSYFLEIVARFVWVFVCMCYTVADCKRGSADEPDVVKTPDSGGESTSSSTTPFKLEV